jgi:hypothetical protein
MVPGSKTPLPQKLFWFVATTMALSGFGPYHGLWHKDTPTKRIDITPTSGTTAPCYISSYLAGDDKSTKNVPATKDSTI